MNETLLECRPIGTIHTPFSSKYSAPRQPGTAVRRTVGTITLEAGKNFEQALKDLEGFGYVWVLFWFDQAKNWKPMVLPPASDRKKRGVFATRSPHRPNPIGLSLCRLLEVKGRTVVVEDPDMLDGTPILDIKPYLPHVEAKPRAARGWIGGSHERSKPTYKVLFSPAVTASLRALPSEERSMVRAYVRQILARDPHPHSYRRIKAEPDGSWVLSVQRRRFVYRVEGTIVRVDRTFTV
jgi:tRNA-Thr(GGU) m(6)t(6)A37 methyltransferase TsaA